MADVLSLRAFAGDAVDLTFRLRKPDGTPRDVAGATIHVEARHRWTRELALSAEEVIVDAPGGLVAARLAVPADHPDDLLDVAAWIDDPESGDLFGAPTKRINLGTGWLTIIRRAP